MYQKGKAGEVKQACECQVQHNYGSALPRCHLEAVNTNCNDISQEAHQEDDAVHNGEVQSLQTDINISVVGKITFTVFPGSGAG